MDMLEPFYILLLQHNIAMLNVPSFLWATTSSSSNDFGEGPFHGLHEGCPDAVLELEQDAKGLLGRTSLSVGYSIWVRARDGSTLAVLRWLLHQKSQPLID